MNLITLIIIFSLTYILSYTLFNLLYKFNPKIFYSLKSSINNVKSIQPFIWVLFVIITCLLWVGLNFNIYQTGIFLGIGYGILDAFLKPKK